MAIANSSEVTPASAPAMAPSVASLTILSISSADTPSGISMPLTASFTSMPTSSADTPSGMSIPVTASFTIPAISAADTVSPTASPTADLTADSTSAAVMPEGCTGAGVASSPQAAPTRNTANRDPKSSHFQPGSLRHAIASSHRIEFS